MSFQIIRNDIVNMTTDAIVDPTDQFYTGLGGADGAIHRAAGPGLRRACNAMLSCPTGEARITPGFDLRAKFVIHTVGPVWKGGGHRENELLYACYRNSLLLAAEAGLKSIAFPLLASGTFGYPKEDAIHTAVNAIREFLNDHEMTVYLVVYTKEAVRLSEERYGEVASFISATYVNEHRHLISREIGERFRSIDSYNDVGALPVQSMPEEAAEPHIRSGMPRRDIEKKARRDEPTGLWDQCEVQPTLENMLKQKDQSFIEALIGKIDERGMKDSECYKKANVDKTVFNKIKNKAGYKPQKSTVIALIFALDPTKEEFDELMQRAGYALSMNNEFDIIITYCLQKKMFDVYDVNDLLFQFDQPLLGAK